MNKPIIIGEGKTYMAKAFYDVREWLYGHTDVVLFAQMAKLLGEEIPQGATIYNMEPLYPGCSLANVGYLDVLRDHKVVDYQLKNLSYLHAQGIKAEYMPYGYHKGLERVPCSVDKDIDVLFFGGVNDRRIKVLKELERTDLRCKIITYGCYEEELDETVARSKVVLNMHYQDYHPLEVVRLNYLLANECFVVSEKGWDQFDNAMYQEGLVFADYADLVKKCKEYLVRGMESNRAYVASCGLEIMRSMQSDFAALGGGAICQQ